MTASIEAAFDAGIDDPDTVFRMTPWQLSLKTARAAEGERRSWRLAMSTAWHAAGFQRTKRMPDLRAVMEQMDSPEEKAARMRASLGRALDFAEARKRSGAPPPQKPTTARRRKKV